MKNYLSRIYRTPSLVRRFVVSSLIILPLFIIASGTLLLNSYQHSRIIAEEEKLQAQIYLLLSVTEIEGGKPILPEVLTEPRLNQVHSGLYAFIKDENQKELWRSASSKLLEKNFIQNKPFVRNQRFFSNNFISSKENEESKNSHHLNSLTYDTEWIEDNGEARKLRFIVSSDSQSLNNEIINYRNRLWQWLGLMGIGLLFAQVFIMRWGLQPLRRLSKELQALKNHTINTLSNNYPSEIQPVIDDLNGILQQEKEQRERYRNTMADLAHSVKTPLAVLRSQLSLTEIDTKDNNDKKLNEQLLNEHIDRIDQIINHQLQRAVLRTNNAITRHTSAINVHAAIERLTSTFQKVYKNKNINLKNLSDPSAKFYGEESDLLEVLGNIIDNACKYGKNDGEDNRESNKEQNIVLTAEYINQRLYIKISDSGAGIPDDKKQVILKRGERIDSANLGQGIGLSITADIVSSYGGEIIVGNNEKTPHLSGACFTIIF